LLFYLKPSLFEEIIKIGLSYGIYQYSLNYKVELHIFLNKYGI